MSRLAQSRIKFVEQSLQIQSADLTGVQVAPAYRAVRATAERTQDGPQKQVCESECRSRAHGCECGLSDVPAGCSFGEPIARTDQRARRPSREPSAKH